jgi:hypothetical protein
MELWSLEFMKPDYQIPDRNRKSFARTNIQTIQHRISIILELFPQIKSIAEICCGDCLQLQQSYQMSLNITRYVGLDIHPDIVAWNRSRGIECLLGDALEKDTLQRFVDFDLIFFGPPLSVDCDGHRLLTFQEVIPSYGDFGRLLFGELNYKGTLICICPKETTMGDVSWLYTQITELRKEVGLRLIHSSSSTVTGDGEETDLRLKYLELWFSSYLEDAWEIRESRM